MREIIEVENYIDADWVRHLHLMSSVEIDEAEVRSKYGVGDAKLTVNCEAGVHHLHGEWKARGLFAGTYRDFPREMPIVLWAMDKGEQVRLAIAAAAFEYLQKVGRLPRFAGVQALPKGVEEGVDVPVHDGAMVSLILFDKCLSGFVVVF